MLRYSGRMLSTAVRQAAVKRPSADLFLPLMRQRYGIIEGSPREKALRAILEDTSEETPAPASCEITPPAGFKAMQPKQKPKERGGAPEGFAVWWRMLPLEIKNKIEYDDPDEIIEMARREPSEVLKYWRYVIEREHGETF